MIVRMIQLPTFDHYLCTTGNGERSSSPLTLPIAATNRLQDDRTQHRRRVLIDDRTLVGMMATLLPRWRAYLFDASA
jgi:hypothetical protein